VKFFTILSIYLGESLIIGAEVLTAKYTLANQASTPFVIIAMIVGALGSVLTVWGYFIGIRIFSSIWVVTAICITSIIILEPFIIYFLTREIPGRGALVGLVFGVLGFIATLIL